MPTSQIYAYGVLNEERTSIENPNLPLNDPKIWESVFGESYGTESGGQMTAERALMYAPVWQAISLISFITWS